MKGGGFSVNGQASVTGNGVVIINVPGGPSDTISVTGQGVVPLGPQQRALTGGRDVPGPHVSAVVSLNNYTIEARA